MITHRQPRIIVQLPTGGGKTIVAAFMAQSHISRGGRVMFLCHRDFLLDQTSQSFQRIGLQHTHIAPGRFYSEHSRAWVGTVQTASRRIGKLHEPSLVIWDEGHHILASTWTKLIDSMPYATHVILTATPIRTDGTGFADVVDDLVVGPSTRDLMDIGALSDYAYYAPDIPDLKKYHTRGGDYKKDEIDYDMGKSRVVGSLVGHYHKLTPHRRAVYFCTSVKNSMDTAEAFRSAGYSFTHLDAKSSSHERRQASRALASGELHGITNVDLMGEGYDLAAQAGVDVTIEVVGLARPTKSRVLATQQRGRVLRPKDYPGIILDHAGVVNNFGLPDDPVVWSLDGAKSESVSRLYECSSCGAKNRDSGMICSHCGGATRPDRMSSGGGDRSVEFVEGDLKEIRRQAQEARAAAHKDRMREQGQARTVAELVDLARRRGVKYPEAWADHVYRSRAAKSGAMR